MVKNIYYELTRNTLIFVEPFVLTLHWLNVVILR